MFTKFANIKKSSTFAAKFANSMDIVFQKDYLSDLYYTGKTSDKQHRYQPEVVRKYVRVVGISKWPPNPMKQHLPSVN